MGTEKKIFISQRLILPLPRPLHHFLPYLLPPPQHPPKFVRASPPESHTHILTLNVGPHCLRAALPNLLADLESRPAIVLLQECHSLVTSLAEVRRTVHKLLTAYTVFANR